VFKQNLYEFYPQNLSVE